MNHTKDFINQIFAGKSIGRIMFNWLIEAHCRDIRGEVLDLACGQNPSYYRYLPAGLNIIKADNLANPTLDETVDLNRKLPWTDGSQENIFLFASLYIIKDPVALLREIKRVKKMGGGKIFISTPLIIGEIREPLDYWRFTYDGLDLMFREAGFTKFTIIRFGERFTAAASLLDPFYYFRIIRLLVYALSMGLDKLIPSKLKNNYPTPLGYLCVIEE